MAEGQPAPALSTRMNSTRFPPFLAFRRHARIPLTMRGRQKKAENTDRPFSLSRLPSNKGEES